MKIHTYKKFLIIAVPLLIIVLIILSVFLFNRKSNNEYSNIKNSIECVKEKYGERTRKMHNMPS